MTILIGKYEFEGPFNSITYLREQKGLFAVLNYDGVDYELIHLAQADSIRGQIELSESAYGPAAGKILLAACYTPRSGVRERCEMIDEIQGEFDEQEEQKRSDKRILSATSS